MKTNLGLYCRDRQETRGPGEYGGRRGSRGFEVTRVTRETEGRLDFQAQLDQLGCQDPLGQKALE